MYVLQRICTRVKKNWWFLECIADSEIKYTAELFSSKGLVYPRLVLEAQLIRTVLRACSMLIRSPYLLCKSRSNLWWFMRKLMTGWTCMYVDRFTSALAATSRAHVRFCCTLKSTDCAQHMQIMKLYMMMEIIKFCREIGVFPLKLEIRN